MVEINIRDAKKITVEYLKKHLTIEQKEILIGSKFNYDDIIDEIKLMCAIFNDRDDIVINVAEIFESIKEINMMPSQKIFGV